MACNPAARNLVASPSFVWWHVAPLDTAAWQGPTLPRVGGHLSRRTTGVAVRAGWSCCCPRLRAVRRAGSACALVPLPDRYAL